MKNILIFASGNGSNAQKIIQYLDNNSIAKVLKIFTNKTDAGVLNIASKNAIPSQIISKTELNSTNFVTDLQKLNPDLIVLAGFLLQFPKSIIEKFPNKIINIHPALLPNYGGKGMFGMHVHRAVFENKEIETGITIHYIDENYDEGEFIFQKTVNIENCKSPQEISQKVQTLEHQYFPVIVENVLIKNL